MKSSAVPNSLKPLHTCREQISNNPLLYLSSRITVLIYSEQRSSRRRLTPPTSHTTVQADPHTAVQLALHDCSRTNGLTTADSGVSQITSRSSGVLFTYPKMNQIFVSGFGVFPVFPDAHSHSVADNSVCFSCN